MTGITLQQLGDLGFELVETNEMEVGHYAVYEKGGLLEYTIEYNEQGEAQLDYFSIFETDIPQGNLNTKEYLQLINLIIKAFDL